MSSASSAMNTNAYLTLDERRQKANGTYPIVLRLIHNRKPTSLPSGYAVATEHWDSDKAKIRKSCPGIENLIRVNNILDKMRTKAIDVINRINDSGKLDLLNVQELKAAIIDELNPNQKAIADKKKALASNQSFYTYTEQLIETLREQQSIGNALTYKNVLREVKKFAVDKDFMFTELTYQWLMRFDAYYLKKGGEINGLSLYMRTIRAIVNRAIKDKLLAKDAYPFDDYSIKSMPTKKRAIDSEAIERIAGLEIEMSSPLYEVRNIFLLSFYLMGTPFVDLACLKVSSIIDGRLQYRRQKTGKFMDIKISEALKPILASFTHGKAPSAFILPIIKRTEPEAQYRDMLWARKRYNKRLKEIAVLAGIQENLTSYVSRHSFASAANNLAIPLTAISEMMGHTRISTTQVYLSGLKKDVLDDYNDLIIAGR